MLAYENSISGMTFRDCGNAVVATGQLIIENSHFFNGGTGIKMDSGNLSVISSLFSNHSTNGILFGGDNLYVNLSIFENNHVVEFGGGIKLSSIPSVLFSYHNKFINNSAVNGGAIHMAGTSSHSHLFDDYFFNNSASSGGGAVYGGVIANNSVFEKNNANLGGAVKMDNGINLSGYFTNCSFINNQAHENGGAICQDNGPTVFIFSSNFYGNFALFGGAVYGSTFLEIDSSHFTENHADYGGSIYIPQSYVTNKIQNCQFNNNSASNSTGGIHSIFGNWDIRDSFFFNNSLAIYLHGGTSITIYRCNFDNNGQAIFVDDTSSTTTITECTFENHTSSTGAVHIFSTYAIMFSSTFKNNDAGDGFGGAIYVNEGDLSISGVIEGNKARRGGAIALQSSSIHFYSTLYCGNNEATEDGGCIYAVGSRFVFVDALKRQDSYFFASIFNNTAKRGGGLFSIGGSISGGLGVFRNNSAEEGGGMWLGNLTTTQYPIYGFTFANNSANIGGGIFATTNVLRIIYNLIYIYIYSVLFYFNFFDDPSANCRFRYIAKYSK